MLQVKCIEFSSRNFWSLHCALTLTGRSGSYEPARSRFEIFYRLQLEHKAATLVFLTPRIASPIISSATRYKQNEMEGNYIPPMPGLVTKK